MASKNDRPHPAYFYLNCATNPATFRWYVDYIDETTGERHAIGDYIQLNYKIKLMSDEQIDAYCELLCKQMAATVKGLAAIQGGYQKMIDISSLNDVRVGDVVYTVDYTVDAEIGTEDYVINERFVTGVCGSYFTTVDRHGNNTTVISDDACKTIREATSKQKALYVAKGWTVG